MIERDLDERRHDGQLHDRAGDRERTLTAGAETAAVTRRECERDEQGECDTELPPGGRPDLVGHQECTTRRRGALSPALVTIGPYGLARSLAIERTHPALDSRG